MFNNYSNNPCRWKVWMFCFIEIPIIISLYFDIIGIQKVWVQKCVYTFGFKIKKKSSNCYRFEINLRTCLYTKSPIYKFNETVKRSCKKKKTITQQKKENNNKEIIKNRL